MRKIYHAIARKTHPDSIDFDVKNTALMNESRTYYNKRDLARLIQVAQKIGIEVSNYITEVDFPLLDYNLEKIQESINKSVESSAWKLSKKSTEERREFAITYWKNKRDILNI